MSATSEQRLDELATEMTRAMLGCAMHVSGVLVTWARCRQELGSDTLAELGRRLIEKSRERKKRSTSQRGCEREELVQPFVAALFGVPSHAGSAASEGGP
jgi:hypothetical protein